MRKWAGILLSLLLLWMVIPNAASAHTGLETSNPANNETVREHLKEIVMDFETVIEPVSKFTVKDDQGNDYPVSNIVIDQARMSGTMAEPLKDGVYTVTWKIIGLDGHAVDGQFTFRVEAPAPAETASSTPVASAEPSASSPEPTDTSLPEASASPSVDPAPDSESGGDKAAQAEPTTNTANTTSSASWLLLALAGAVLVLFVVMAMLKKKKQG